MNRSSFRQHFVAFQHRNYRLLWFGQLVSFTGSMMQNAAILWHVSLLVPEDKKGLALGAVTPRWLKRWAYRLVVNDMRRHQDRRRAAG